MRAERSAIGDRHPARDPALAFDLEVKLLEADEGGVERNPDGEWIVQRDTAIASASAEGKSVQREVRHEARNARVAAVKPCGQLLRAEDDLAGHVERHEFERQSGLEHHRGAFRVDVEVELRSGGDVARHGDGAPHDDNPGDLPQALGVPLGGLREVGEGAKGDNDQVLPEAIGHFENQIGPVGRLKVVRDRRIAWATVGFDEAIEVTQPVVTVDVAGRDEGSLERRGLSSGGPRHRLGPDDVQNAEDVVYGLVDRDIAGDHGDGLDGRARRGKRQQQRERIVDARVGVDQERHLTGPEALRIIRASQTQRRIG